MDEKLKANLSSGKTWLRLVYIVLFALFFQLAIFVLSVVVIVQFIFVLFRGSDNVRIRSFASSLAQYVFQTISFLTYNSDEKPFPFSDWPEPSLGEILEGEVELASETPAQETKAKTSAEEKTGAQEEKAVSESVAEQESAEISAPDDTPEKSGTASDKEGK